MPRPRKSVPPIEIKSNLPADLAASVDLLLWDPVARKPRYGARSALITHLLRQWVRENTLIDGTPTSDAAALIAKLELAKETSDAE